MGQILFAPPNVKGWDGGKSWISTSTLLFRYNFSNYLINGDAMLAMNPQPRGNGANVGFRPRLERAEQIQRVPIDVRKIVPDELREKPKELVDFLSSRLFQSRPTENEASTFVQYLESRKPDTGDETIRGLLHLMMSTPQFQLA
jgi:hypothetical protein